jgi:hypothetical protein
MANVKGSVLRSRVDYVENQFGRQRLDQVLALLPEEDRHTFKSGLLPAQWYPFALGERLETAILQSLGEEGRSTFTDLGRQSATYNLGGVHKVFVRAGDPHHLLSRAPAIYKLYYDTGSRTYEKTGENACRLVTSDAEVTSVGDCLTVMGWHQRAVEMCDGRDVVTEHPRCRARGDAVCEYLISWNLETSKGDT